MKNEHWRKYLIFTLFCAAIYFPLFLHLDWQPINNWDESLFAMRAGYMTEEGKYLRDYSLWTEGGPLHRSTKPPFTTWLQVASMKILGINELALRLPIAICALLTVLLFLWVARKEFGDIRIGYCAGFVLVTSVGFVREHAARTGDHDAALAFYMLAGAVAFYKYLQATEARQRHGWLALLTLSVIASLLTKYIFGLFFFPAFLIYAIYKKQLWNILKRGSTWLAALGVVLTVGGWLVYIERQLPGFVERAFLHEMTNRYTEAYLGHEHIFTHYFDRFWRSYFMPWLLLLPVPLYLLFSKQHPRLRDFTLLMFLCAAVQLLIVSFSKTKTDHYDVVAYPPMAMLAGIGLHHILAAIVHFWKEKNYRPAVFTAAFLVGLFLIVRPYDKIFNRIYKPKSNDRTMKYGYLLRKIQKTRPEYKDFTLLEPGFTGQAIFYAGLLNRKKGYDIQLSQHPEWVAEGDTVMACETKIIEYLLGHYELQAIETYEKCFLAIAKKKKEVGIGK